MEDAGGLGGSSRSGRLGPGLPLGLQPVSQLFGRGAASVQRGVNKRSRCENLTEKRNFPAGGSHTVKPTFVPGFIFLFFRNYCTNFQPKNPRLGVTYLTGRLTPLHPHLAM